MVIQRACDGIGCGVAVVADAFDEMLHVHSGESRIERGAWKSLGEAHKRTR